MNLLFSLLTGTFGILLLIITFIITGSFASWLAGNKGYENTGTWFFIGFFFGFIGLIAIGFATNKNYERYLIKMSSVSSSILPTEGSSLISNNSKKMKTCPKCGKQIPRVASSCGSCGASV